MTVQENSQPELRLKERGERASPVEFWRFAFTVLVAVYHLEIYFMRRSLFVSGVSAVEFFFMLAGFLMAKSANRTLAERTEPVTVREAHGQALDFVKKKLKAIYPVLIAVMIIWAVTVLTSMQFMNQGQSKVQMLLNSEWELLLLVGTPFGFNDGLTSNIPMWFLTALIAVGYIYTYLIYKHYDFVAFAAPIAGLLFYIFFALNAPTILEHGTKMGFLNAGMVKAFAEMSLGVALYHLYAYLSKRRWGIAWRIALSLLELFAVYRFFALTLNQTGSLDNYRRIVYIMIILLLSFLNVTALSKLLSGRVSRLLGRLSLAVYLSHYCLITVYFWMLGKLKMKLIIFSGRSSFARKLSSFLKDTGGGYGTSGMKLKDMLLYMLLVVCVSVVILLAIGGVKRAIAAVRRRAQFTA